MQYEKNVYYFTALKFTMEDTTKITVKPRTT